MCGPTFHKAFYRLLAVSNGWQGRFYLEQQGHKTAEQRKKDWATFDDEKKRLIIQAMIYNRDIMVLEINPLRSRA